MTCTCPQQTLPWFKGEYYTLAVGFLIVYHSTLKIFRVILEDLRENLRTFSSNIQFIALMNFTT
jgi:GTPase SAR1 family protein